jgi:hypothetical protein
MAINQIKLGLPKQHHFHLGQEVLAFGAILASGFLIVRDVEPLATHQPNPGLLSQSHCPVVGPGFPETPYLSSGS